MSRRDPRPLTSRGRVDPAKRGLWGKGEAPPRERGEREELGRPFAVQACVQGAGLREAGPPRCGRAGAARFVEEQGFPGWARVGRGRGPGRGLGAGRGPRRSRQRPGSCVFFARKAPRWPFAWGVERCFPDPGRGAGGTGWGACLTGVLSASRPPGEMKGALLARCVAPPLSVVYFCQNGLPAPGSSTKMNPFTSFGKVSLLDVLGSNHSFLVTSTHFRWLVCLLESGKLGPVCLFHAFPLL